MTIRVHYIPVVNFQRIEFLQPNKYNMDVHFMNALQHVPGIWEREQIKQSYNLLFGVNNPAFRPISELGQGGVMNTQQNSVDANTRFLHGNIPQQATPGFGFPTYDFKGFRPSKRNNFF